jgi:hypothetical protein
LPIYLRTLNVHVVSEGNLSSLIHAHLQEVKALHDDPMPPTPPPHP